MTPAEDLERFRRINAAKSLSELTPEDIAERGRFYIYFAKSEAGGWFKIGCTTNVAQRMLSICQHLATRPLVLSKVIHGMHHLEHTLHRILAPHQVPPLMVNGSRECFSAVSEIEAWFARIPDAACWDCKLPFPRRVLGLSNRDEPRPRPSNYFRCSHCKRLVALPWGRAPGGCLWRKLRRQEVETATMEGWTLEYDPRAAA
jgi:hypothetical protein